MKNILKKFLVALIITAMGFTQVGTVLAAKPNSSFTLIDSLIKSSKPTPEPETTVWKYNGTTDGYCNDLSYDESAPAGKQQWLFILTSPATSGAYELTAKFDDSENNYTENGNRKGKNGAVHFTVDTAVGAKLESASAITGTRNSVLTVSHCIHGVKPLDVEKTAETSFTRTWDWEIDKVGKNDQGEEVTGLGDLTDEDLPKTVTYEITLSAEDTDHDYLVKGDITITNPVGNPTATIDSIIDQLNMSGSVDVTCPEELGFELLAGAEVTCDYSQEVENNLDTENTVTVDATFGGLDLQTVATADVDWSDDPKDEIDECVDLTDTNPLFTEGGEVCATDLVEGSRTFTYYVVFGVGEEVDEELICGVNDYDNTASFIANDTQSEGDTSWIINYDYLCPLLACGFSQGSWLVSNSINWPVSFIPLGGQAYSEEDSKAIFPANTTPKLAFRQFAALYLTSELLGLDYPTELVDDMDTIDQFFTGEGIKFDGNNITTASQEVQDAAGAIGDWISANPCSEELKNI